MKLEQIKFIEETKSRIIKILEERNITGLVFGAIIDDQEIENQFTLDFHYCGESRMASIGLSEVLKNRILKDLNGEK